MSDDLLATITTHYLNSGDFNGIVLTNLGDDMEHVRRGVRELVENGKVVLNFGDRHPNPHILAFAPEPKNEQIIKLDKLVFEPPVYEDIGPLRWQRNQLSCCVYPSKIHLSSVVDAALYRGNPYELALALGESQLAYRAFNLRVLEFYRNDPRYSYETDDIQGHISSQDKSGHEPADDTFLQSFGFAYTKDMKRRFVAAFVRDLSGLTPEHQQRWKLDEVEAETFLHPDFAKAMTGEWSLQESIFNAFCEEIRIINEMSMQISGKRLFRKSYSRENKPIGFGFLIRPTRKSYDDFVHLLDKMMSDNLDKKFFRGSVPLTFQEKKGDIVKEIPKGTMTLLDEWLSKSVRFQNPEPKDKMIATFKDVRAARAPLAHDVKADEWNDAFFANQRELAIKAYDAMRTLRLILANHPRAQTVNVPEWLYNGDICTF
jgi:hypothetical protein